MIRFFDYFNDSFRFALYTINYKMIENGIDRELALNVGDDIKIERDEAFLVVYYSRHISFEPEDNFDMTVTYKILFNYNQKNDPSKLTNQEIIDALYDNGLDSLDQVAARMSLTVSQIVFSGGYAPLILPPNVIRPD